jgi:hypothetical protein
MKLHLPSQAVLFLIPLLPAQQPLDTILPPMPAGAVRFVANHGQWDTEARFVARTGGMVFGLEPGAIAVQLHAVADDGEHRGHLLRLSFADGARPEPRAGAALSGVHHFLIGNDRRDWRTDVPAYAGLAYDEVAPGWSVVLRSEGGVVHYDVHARAGVAPESIVFHCAGAERLERRGDELWLHTPIGALRQSAPVAWQFDGARRLPVRCSFVVLDDERYAFAVPDRDPSLPLVVDPGLTFSTLLGSGSMDAVRAFQIDSQGRPVVAGRTGLATPPFPTTPGAFQSTAGSFGAVFITKFTADGTGLVFSTLLTANNSLTISRHFLALDASDRPVVTVSTRSTNYPTTPGAFATALNGIESDATLTVFTANGSGLVYSTYLGGSLQDESQALAVMPNGDIVVAGGTVSTNFPKVNTLPNLGGSNDGFVCRFNSSFQLVYSGYFGGNGGDTVFSLLATPQSDAILLGTTTSSNFPTTPGAFRTSAQIQGIDVFVTRLGIGGALIFSTLLGGNSADAVRTAALASDGSVYLVCFTNSTNFPFTPGSFNPTNAGDIVVRMLNNGTGLVFATSLPQTTIEAIAVDPFDSAIVVGHTSFSTFPTTPGALDRQLSIPGFPTTDGTITRFDPLGTTLRYSTFFGHTAHERIFAAYADHLGGVYVGGEADQPNASTSFPTTPGAFQTTFLGGTDAFLSHLDLVPAGAQRFGTGAAGCNGVPVADISSQAFVGNAGFGFLGAKAPPNGIGVLGIGHAGLAVPLPVQGILLWIDPAGGLVLNTAFANAAGNSTLLLPIPNAPTLAGVTLVGQFAWLDLCAPLGLSASDAIAATIQP